MEDCNKEAVGDADGEKSSDDEHCKFITWGGTITGTEKVPKLQTDIKTIMVVCHEATHYEVMKIDIKRKRVLIWDAARVTSHSIEKYWKIHAIRALKIHQPYFVQSDEGNIVTNTEQTRLRKENDGELPLWNQENGYPLWLVQGIKEKDSYIQTDYHSCGPIAINKFATALKKLHNVAKEKKISR
jgi:hypothetical protein